MPSKKPSSKSAAKKKSSSSGGPSANTTRPKKSATSSKKTGAKKKAGAAKQTVAKKKTTSSAKKTVPAKKTPGAKKAVGTKKTAVKKTGAAKRTVGSKKKTAAVKKTAERGAKPSSVANAHDEAREALQTATSAAIEAAWAGWGTVDPAVLTHLINPMFMGGPRWPGVRQAYRVVRKGPSVLLASDGLADPFLPADPADRNGHGLEVYAIAGEAPESIPGSWLWTLVWQTAQLAAGRPDIGDLIEELGLVSSELYDVKIPDEHAARFVNDAGRVGVLLNLTHPSTLPPSVDGPLSKIRLVNVKLLTLSELAFVVQGGESARAELAKRFGEAPDPLTSSLTRASVVEP
ncbi:MAG: hypothetical protein U0414_18595 [Polyangiaceae bacterium]